MKLYRLYSGGFTLLEVMVSLAVAAIGLGAVSKSMIGNVDVAAKLQHRTIATWVASNRMAELRMYRQFTSNGSRSGEAEMAGLEWKIEENYASTPDPNIARIDIEVFMGEGDRAAASLTGYLARYRPAVGVTQ